MHSVDISPLYQIANDAVLTLLAGIVAFAVAWAAYLLHKYAPAFVGAQLQAKAIDALNTALNNGVAVAMQKIEGVEKLHSNVEVKSAIVAMAARYAATHAPEAMKAFGLDLDALETKALAYLPPPPLSGAGTTGATVHTMPVALAPLGKI